MHADGQLAQGSIALCEVQAYVYAAKQGAAVLAAALGEQKRARRAGHGGGKIAVQFEANFWIEELGTYALALDGDKRPCKVQKLQCRAGAGLAALPRRNGRKAVAATLMMPEMFSGWGVRTLSADAPRFNPMSYHNGSVWPHDNALIALGLSRYGLKRGGAGDLRRPVRRRHAYGDDALSRTVLRLPAPARHRAGALSGGLRAAGLGQRGALRAAAGLLWAWIWISPSGEIRFHNPQLPRFMEEVHINGLALGEASA